MKEIIDIPPIGEVTFVRSKRARNLRISIKPLEGVRVTRPYLMSKRKAISYVLEKQSWIEKHLKNMEILKEDYTIFTADTFFETTNHKLKITAKEGNRFGTRLVNDIMKFSYPNHLAIEDELVQKRIRQFIEKTWKKEAEEHLIPRIAELANLCGFKYQSCVIKNVKSKWGSCSYYNDIILSLHLMRVPKHLQDYVILHELCHTLEKNHQKPFWELMSKVTNGHAKNLDKELKKYSTKIY